MENGVKNNFNSLCLKGDSEMNTTKLVQILSFISAVVIPVATMTVSTVLTYIKSQEQTQNEMKEDNKE